MKILYCGAISTPFINEDMRNLKTAYKIDIFDMSDMQISIGWILNFFILSFTRIPYMILTNDLVYLWFPDYPTMPVIFWSNLFGKPTISNVGGYEVSGIREIGYGNQLKLFRGMVSRWCIRNSTVVIVPSESYKRKTKDIEPDSNVVVVPNAIDTDILCNLPLPEKEFKSVTAIHHPERDWHLKGIPVFMAAQFNPIYKQHILFKKTHSEFIEELLKSKVYCQLSLTESCGVAVLEAMACGCVPVVSDVDDLPALIGNTGVVVPVKNTEKTGLGIERAMMMDGEPARNRARKFGFVNRLKKLERIINHICYKEQTP
jgi:glycosyltransferase involved in cell wall biosynthesis